MRRAVLFVDDEQRVLDGLRRGLRELRHAWDLRFVLGGEAAVEALDDGLSAVVTDMRMPGLDGVDVLRAARERAPRAARLVLSGNSDRGAARRAAFVAHRFLAKPCDAATLAGLLPVLARSVEAADGAACFAAPPSSPGAVARLLALLQREAPVAEVASLVVADPGLSLTLLHAASSAFFGPPALCEDVARAVQHLGPLVLADLLEESASACPTAAVAPRPHADATVGALAGLAAVAPVGALLPALELRGLAPGLLQRVAGALGVEAA